MRSPNTGLVGGLHLSLGSKHTVPTEAIVDNRKTHASWRTPK
jgi:hypothetical protein